MKKSYKICMIVPQADVKGGIASVVNGYHNSIMEKENQLYYIESYRDGNKIDKLLKAIKSYFKYMRVLCLYNPDLIHIHSSFGLSFYRKLPFIWIGNKCRIPIINHIHGSEFDKFYTNASNRKKALVVKVFAKCSQLIVLSEEWKNRLSEVMPKEKISIVENYTEIQPIDLDKKKNQILYLGLINENKGCFDIPQIVKMVAERINDFKFVLGGVGEIDSVKSQLKYLKVSHLVDFPGWVCDDEKARYLNESKIFFLPSYTEAMPMSILEAIGHGAVVVSTNVGGIPNVITTGVNGMLCKPGDINGFVEALILLLNNNELRKDYAEKAFDVAKLKFTKEIHLEKILSLYRKILND